LRQRAGLYQGHCITACRFVSGHGFSRAERVDNIPEPRQRRHFAPVKLFHVEQFGLNLFRLMAIQIFE
jgi:hypothetical protein